MRCLAATCGSWLGVTVMPRGDVELFHQDGQWHLRVEGTIEPHSTYRRRRDAHLAGRALARELGVEFIVRRLDGTICERSYPSRRPLHR
jgi:Uncharacterized protein conserved in bacteria (DUF2188)